MYRLEYLGVVKITDDKTKANKLISDGYKLVMEETDVEDKKETNELDREALESYTKAEIIEILDEKGIEYTGKMNKEELLDLI